MGTELFYRLKQNQTAKIAQQSNQPEREKRCLFSACASARPVIASVLSYNL